MLVSRKAAASKEGSGVTLSLCSRLPSSEVSEEEDVIDSSADSSESDAVEGAYSCLRGEEERRSPRRPLLGDGGFCRGFRIGPGLASSW